MTRPANSASLPDRRKVDATLARLLAAFLLLGLLYTWATPVLEASDEPHHFALAEYVSRHWTLPIQVPGEVTPWAQEGAASRLFTTSWRRP